MFIKLDDDIRVNSSFVISYRKYSDPQGAFAIHYKIALPGEQNDFYVAFASEQDRDRYFKILDDELGAIE